MSVEPETLAQMGEMLIGEAIMCVLPSHDTTYGMGAAEISKRAGISRYSAHGEQYTDRIVLGVLGGLLADGRVVMRPKHNGQKGWVKSEHWSSRCKRRIQQVDN